MKVYLNVFETTPELCQELKDLGFQGVRWGPYRSLDEAPTNLTSFRAAGLETILLLNPPGGPPEALEWCSGARALLADMVEVGNEWDLTFPPEQVRGVWKTYHDVLGDRMITGGISSLSDSALAWASRATRDARFPNIGFHAYRPKKAMVPTDRIIQDIARLRMLSPESRFWNTETGWHTCRFRVSCFKTKRFSEEEVAANLRADIAFHRSAAVESYTVYQLNDGPSEAPEDHFGIRRLDGAWKPSAFIL
jgi:hypothetical protein